MLRLYQLGGLLDEVMRRLGDEAWLEPDEVGNLAVLTAEGRVVGCIALERGEVVWGRAVAGSAAVEDRVRREVRRAMRRANQNRRP